jgi:undecaprenyl-phosphate galactose phosphotransferase
MLAWVIAYFSTFANSFPRTIFLFTLFVIWGLYRGLYSKRFPFWTELKLLTVSIITIVLFFIIARVFEKDISAVFSSIQMGIVLLIATPISRTIFRLGLQKLGIWEVSTIIFGTNRNAFEAFEVLTRETSLGMKIIKFVQLDGSEADEEILGTGVDVIPLKQIFNENLKNIYCIIALEANQADERDQIIRKLSSQNVKHLFIIPAMRGVPLFQFETSHFLSRELMMIHAVNPLDRFMLRITKRFFDLIIATVLLIFLLPLFFILAIIISLDGHSPIFYQNRIGKKNTLFKCFKFRTMVFDAESRLKDLLNNDPDARNEWEENRKLKIDPRITKIGVILRKTSLDELPQLLNVIKGDMSLVGPRPVVEAELKLYGDDVSYYLKLRPGITGLWQVSGRNDITYEERVYLDAWYSRNWSFWVDFVILLKTPYILLMRRGAY